MMSTPRDPHPCVAIIGLGLIGGSMAKALSRHGGYRVFAVSYTHLRAHET